MKKSFRKCVKSFWNLIAVINWIYSIKQCTFCIMSQRVYITSKRYRVINLLKLVVYRPEIKRSNGETGAVM